MKRALIDVSSVVWTELQGGIDKEFGRQVISEKDKEVQVNSASYGFEKAMGHLNTVMRDLEITPRQMIFVIEGQNSKADRQAIHPMYKTGRDKAPELYIEFNTCKEMLISAFLGVGAQACWQDGGVEADDVLGYLAKTLKGERWVISGDKDLAQCVDADNGVHHYRQGVIDQNPFGDFPCKYIPVCIALWGDSGDKIPGASGFGEKAWQMLNFAFGEDGLELMEDLIKRKDLLKLEEDVGTLKELQKIIDDQDGVYKSYELGRLRVERVNTMRRPLQWRAGMVKPRDECQHEFLRKHSGVNRIMSAENFESNLDWVRNQLEVSPAVSLDIETATPDESDEWLESRDKADRVDVFGSELVSLQLTFGPNCQYTIYLPYNNVEETGVTNLTMEQIARLVDLVPRETMMFIQNVAFELPICYMSWGVMWSDDPLYRGFLRNVRDTKIMSSYVDENQPAGLKDSSKRLLSYDQVTYAEVTTREEVKSEWDGVGKVLQTYLDPILEDTGEMEEVVTGECDMIDSGALTADGEIVWTRVPRTNTIPKMKHIGDVEKVIVQRKMNQLTARQVLAYGCDDTICTIAVANHFTVVMEIEGSYDVFEEVETYPAYLTALAYVQGTAFSLESMAEQEKEDNEAFDKAEVVLNKYLMDIGFDGTVYVPMTELSPAEIKRACLVLTGKELETKVRTPSKMAKLITELDDESILPALIDAGDLVSINELMLAKFTGKPELDLGSAKQMKGLLYDRMKMPIRHINDTTPIERVKQPELDAAVRKFKKVRAGTSTLTMTDDENELLKRKAKTDDDAIKFGIKFDTDALDDADREALLAIGTMKRVGTMRSLFYKNYWKGLHWKDRLLHCNTNQCAAVSRRYSMSDQNLTQLPKKGTNLRFRSHFMPHKKNAVIASIDFVGQELRLAADTSQDKNLLACYVGDDLKDPHSLTAAGALVAAWGRPKVDALFDEYGADLARDTEGMYLLFLRLLTLPKSNPIRKEAEDHRKGAKNTNFAAQNGARAAKISEMECMLMTDAQQFLDGREKMFPGVTKASDRCGEQAKKDGYATTYMGVRRHLREAMLSNERGAADRAARQAWSTRIQASAVEMTKLAMGRLWLSGIYFRYDARFIAPIHDELVSSVTANDAVAFLKEKNAAMTVPYSTMAVPILGSISLGKNFAEQIECGNWFIQENIEKALNDVFQHKEAA